MTSLTTRRWLPAITWLAAALRFHGLFANRFHADEALFATWSRLIAVWRDPLLLTQAVDKPPLLFYAQALFYPLFGPVEWAARMPSLIASLLLIPATGILSQRLYRHSTAAIISAGVVAVAPLAIQFSATAFSDSLLTFWIVLALLLGVRQPQEGARFHPGVAGLCLGLALATKYQALLFLPLVLGVGWLTAWQRAAWLRWLGGLAAVLVVVLLWQVARPTSTSLLALQWANVGGIRPAWSWELWPRLSQQADLWRLALSWPLVLVGAVLIITSSFALVRRRVYAEPVDGLLVLFVLAYLLLHWLWAVPVWDRYLLPILPYIAVLLGRAVTLLDSPRRSGMETKLPGRLALGALGMIAILSFYPGLASRTGVYPIGGQPAADGGASRVAALLANAPYGTVLYDHWYSWHWRYQLFDHRVYVSWFPHSDALLEDLSVFGKSESPRYLVVPASSAAAPVLRDLEEAGYELQRIDPEGGPAAMTLFRIVLDGSHAP